MERKHILIIFLFLSFIQFLNAQDSLKYKSILIKVNPFSLIVGTYNGQLEIVVGKKQSIQFVGSYTSYTMDFSFGGDNGNSYNGYMLSCEYRHYISKKN